jgi:hypothetical protein
MGSGHFLKKKELAVMEKERFYDFIKFILFDY